MNIELRGRPKLPLTVRQVLEEIREHGTVMAAGRELGCSPAYIYARLNELGLTLAQVLDAQSVELLFKPGALVVGHDAEH